MDNLTTEVAEKLLSIVESRRQHLANIIVAMNGLAITLILGVGSFFIRGYIDYSPNLYYAANLTSNGNNLGHPFSFSYIILAIGFISLICGLWRWYVRYLDYQISKLYPEIILYEQVIGVPPNSGLINTLSADNNIKEVLPNLYKRDRVLLISRLVERKKIGRRGLMWFEVFVFIFFGIAITTVVIDIFNLIDLNSICYLFEIDGLRNSPTIASKWIGYLLVLVGLIIHVVVFFWFQRAPNRRLIQQLLT